MSLLKMCKLRITNIIILVLFVLRQKTAKNGYCNYDPSSEGAIPPAGDGLLL
jgi:hypothetical protein